MVPPLAFVPAVVYWLLPNVRPDAAVFKRVIMIAAYLTVLLAVLFFSGLTAWSKERDKTDDKWGGMSREKKRDFTNLLQGQPSYPGILIYNNDVPDCRTLGADLADAITDANINVPVPPSVPKTWLTSGITIHVRKGETRALVLKHAFKAVLNIDAHIDEGSPDGAPHLFIGCKR